MPGELAAVIFLVSQDGVLGIFTACSSRRQFIFKWEILTAENGSDLRRLNAVLLGSSPGEVPQQSLLFNAGYHRRRGSHHSDDSLWKSAGSKPKMPTRKVSFG